MCGLESMLIFRILPTTAVRARQPENGLSSPGLSPEGRTRLAHQSFSPAVLWAHAMDPVGFVQVATSVDLLAGLRKVVKRTCRCMGKDLTMRLGFSEREKLEGRCGVFLYWRGRLIEVGPRAWTGPPSVEPHPRGSGWAVRDPRLPPCGCWMLHFWL